MPLTEYVPHPISQLFSPSMLLDTRRGTNLDSEMKPLLSIVWSLALSKRQDLCDVFSSGWTGYNRGGPLSIQSPAFVGIAWVAWQVDGSGRRERLAKEIERGRTDWRHIEKLVQLIRQDEVRSVRWE
jgi:hypothetical protein